MAIADGSSGRRTPLYNRMIIVIIFHAYYSTCMAKNRALFDNRIADRLRSYIIFELFHTFTYDKCDVLMDLKIKF